MSRWIDEASADAEAFLRLIQQPTTAERYPLAASIVQRVPVYSGAAVEAMVRNGSEQALCTEWIDVLLEGPGVFAITGALADRAVLDRATEIFTAIIEEQRRTGAGIGDHFAKPGANDRIWNSFEKHALADPDNFIRYYSSACIALPPKAWLGNGYQMTTQVNRVNPGGAAQVPHRDFHLGFMTSQQATEYPVHIHLLSPQLTLQGALAHVDMPLETGPTVYLPYSQLAPEGYVHVGRDDYQAVFAEHHVQLELRAGDAVFFNPALMHGAGHNRSADVLRMANLLQICSGFSRAMESVDRVAVVEAIYPALVEAKRSGTLDPIGVDCVVAAAADGYAFPTNLDTDPAVGGLSPQTQAALVRSGLASGLSPQEMSSQVRAQATRRRKTE
jgi:ectoine hydroxylase-related dioxygenase (phytanoyl-CoA dioxygenase family)